MLKIHWKRFTTMMAIILYLVVSWAIVALPATTARAKIWTNDDFETTQQRQERFEKAKEVKEKIEAEQAELNAHLREIAIKEALRARIEQRVKRERQ